MSRRRVLVTYDIAKDNVRTQLFKLLRAWGDHVQHSVFICELTARERARLVGRVNDIVNHEEKAGSDPLNLRVRKNSTPLKLRGPAARGHQGAISASERT